MNIKPLALKHYVKFPKNLPRKIIYHSQKHIPIFYNAL